MKFNLDIEEALIYPTKGKHPILTLATGGGLLFFYALIFPIIPVLGYLVSALRAGIDGADEPPVFEDWETLFKDGLFAFVLLLIYQVIPFFILTGIIFVFVFLTPSLLESDAGAGVRFLVAIVGLILWVPLLFVFVSLCFAGLTNYAYTGQFGSAFDDKQIRALLTQKPFLLGIGKGLALHLIFIIMVRVLTYLPLFGLLFMLLFIFIGPFISFYLLVISGWLVGDGFAETVRESPEKTAPTDWVG